jgi:polyisoprenoid-binding protein YceI
MTDTTTTTAVTRIVDGIEYPAVGTYALDTSHTRIGFAVRHMAVSKVRGDFTEFSGTLELAENPVDSTISVSIQAGSVDTRDGNRDNHLRTNDFFDVENHPTWTFASTAIRPVNGTEWLVDGDLTIRGVTKQVTLDATLEGVVQDPYGMHRVGFSATTSIDREEFAVSFNGVLEAGGLVVSKKVDIDIEAEATLQG